MRLPPHDLPPHDSSLSLEELLAAVLNENELCDRYADASPGEAIIYHIGLLARDRDKAASELPSQRRADLEAIARRSLAMAEAGLGYLLQRRVAPGCCAYLLVVGQRPSNARSTAGYALAALLHREAA
jgi:hypothetical protein